MRSKTSHDGRAVCSSIYWNSVDSSSGSGSSLFESATDSRNYVDPWDLENYAYLRRHSLRVAAAGYSPTPQPIYNQTNATRYDCSRMPQHLSAADYCRYSSATSVIREPGYDSPASVEEIYFRGSSRPLSSATCYYQQPIYEDESCGMSYYGGAAQPSNALLLQYSAAHEFHDLSAAELEQAEVLEELRTREMLRRRSKITRSRNNYSSRDECLHHRRPSEMRRYATLTRSRLYAEEEEESLVDEVEAIRCREPIKPTHITLNTYGHLKIDYTNSWNSLYRKIVSN